MACSVFGGSCSLCPWCGEEQCPHFHDHDNDKRYWVYANDREGSYLIPIGNFDTKKEVVAFVKKLVNRKWAKKYRWSFKAGEKTRKGWKCIDEYLPLVGITITDGECSWNDDISLLINTEDKTIHYYDIWRTKFNDHPDVGEPRHIELVKKWDGKLKFTDHRELPWFPTPEEWEARRRR